MSHLALFWLCISLRALCLRFECVRRWRMTALMSRWQSSSFMVTLPMYCENSTVARSAKLLATRNRLAY